jgi:hypothetical protein
MKSLLFTAWIGNAIDMVSTLHLTKNGFVEANPVMRRVLEYPAAFVLVKLGTMTALVFWLWHRRQDRHAKPLATIAAVVYGAISVYYLWFFAAHF